MDAEQLWETTLDPETAYAENGSRSRTRRMASDVTEMLDG